MSLLKLTINGKPIEVDVPQSRTLAQVLRYDLGLTGTKIGCNEAECGICTVLVDGTPVDSCIYPAFKAQGASVETIEGLSRNGELHPLQQAFLDHGATQCGICTPGLIMTAKALIDEKKAAGEEVTDRDIKIALKDTYCRCTGYQSVISAIKAAANGDVQPYIPEAKLAGDIIGHSRPNPDAVSKIKGTALYTSDYAFPGMLHARTKRAGISHGRIKSIDTSKARALEGVRAVLTHEDVPGSKLHGLVTTDWPALCFDKVRYSGDAVAIVAADTADIAAEAVNLIEVEYETLPAVLNPIDAKKPDAPLVHDDRPDGNLLKHIKVRKGQVEDGFKDADVIVERTYRTPMTEHLFLEPECSIGVPKGYDPSQFGGEMDPDAVRGVKARHGKVTVYCGSQIPYADRDQTAACLGLENEEVRIVATLMGGGFGGKEDCAAQIHVALLAQKTGRPVKMLYRRDESLLFHPKRHATVIRIKTGAKKDGTLTAVEAELYGDGGAYASLSEKVMTRATTHASGPYDVPHVKVDCFAMYTNNTPCGAFRGFGVTQSAFAVESNMDIVAEELGMDPIEFRRRNALDVGKVTCTGQLMRESVGLKETIELVVADMKAHHGSKGEEFRWQWEEGPKKYAWGIGLAYKNTGLGGGAPDKAEAIVEMWLDEDEGVITEVRTSSAEMGQGLPAVLSACAAEELGLPYEKVRVLLGDTDFCPDGGPTTASRQTYVSGNAARNAAKSMRALLAGIAANRLGCSPETLVFKDSKIHADGTSVCLADVLTWAKEDGMETKVSYEYWAPKTKPLGTGGAMHVAFGFGTQAALCEIDTETGKVQVIKVVAAHDVGRVINRMTLEGQVEGGIVMCLGNALTEHFVMENGVPWTNVMARYKMPSIKHTPEIISHFVEHPTNDGPFGAKGVGELSSIPTSPAIANAIYNATGVRVMSLPVDQDTLLMAMKNGDKEVLVGWGDYDPVPVLPKTETVPA
ncbi:MAG: molybdopterin-dependent oxidoreductase [Verrucomicrobia bacterium]|nr:molybdopterin-dependent oxidoreductase [Verrucomicrobiota bacterium]